MQPLVYLYICGYILLHIHIQRGLLRCSFLTDWAMRDALKSGTSDRHSTHAFLYLCYNNLLKNFLFRVPIGTKLYYKMKKIILVAIALMSVVMVQAQTKDEIANSQRRAQNLQTLCDEYSKKKETGLGNVDGYGKSVYEAALLAIANSAQLENLYKRQIGETTDGVTDVTIKKPTLEEWISLATTITGEGAAVKEAVDKVNGAADEAKTQTETASKEKNPMKAAKLAKAAKAAAAVIEFGNAATPILLEESAAQVKAVQQIIETLKSGGNL